MRKVLFKIAVCILVVGFAVFSAVPFQSCNQKNADVKHDTIIVHDTIIKHDTVRIPVNNIGDNCNHNYNNNPNNYNNLNNSTHSNHPVARKPNIYIYPEKEISLNVNISFPKGGSVITSIPAYNEGWNIKVDSTGKIDKTYDYLFYESTQPDNWQYRTGWIIKKDSLMDFFQENMSAYGFNSKEIKDFTDYWIPKFNTYKYYLIYPQIKVMIDNLVLVNYSTKPDDILRLFYTVKGANEKQIMNNPAIITNFKREGFHVAEWGVVLK